MNGTMNGVPSRLYASCHFWGNSAPLLSLVARGGTAGGSAAPVDENSSFLTLI